MYSDVPLFTSGEQGYHTYRIPALAVTVKGTLLAFAEGRKYDSHDTGNIDIVLKRSFDGGSKWTDMQIVRDNGVDTAGNPCPIVDRRTGTIWLPFNENLADGAQAMIMEGEAPRTVLITGSIDDGASWSAPRDITADVKPPDWTWYATGPGHGIQLSDGRLVAPCDHTRGTTKQFAKSGYHDSRGFHATNGFSHLIYSDDYGQTWQIGGIGQAGTNECMAVETVDGAIYLNSRNYKGDQRKRRAYAWSHDRGETLTGFGWDEALREPICQGSIVRYSAQPDDGRNRILFANPASDVRERMTVRISYDEARSWSAGKVLHAGLSAYSDLAVLPDKTICCLYERGSAGLYETINLARFDLNWLTDGADAQ